MRIKTDEQGILLEYGVNRLRVQPWGPDGIRVMMTAETEPDRNDWALTEKPAACSWRIETEEVDMTDPWYRGEEYARYHMRGTRYRLINGKLTALISEEGWLSFLNQDGKVLLQECWRNRDRVCRYAVPVGIPARELKPIPGSRDFRLNMRFEADDLERIYGMKIKLIKMMLIY